MNVCEHESEVEELALLKWSECKNKDTKWAQAGLVYVKTYKNNKNFKSAVIICECILKHVPKFNNIKREYGWNLYYAYIKQPNNIYAQVIEAANKVLTLYKPMESYTAYVLTCLSVAEYFLDSDDPVKAKTWLTKLDIYKLDSKSLEYSVDDEVHYWSQLRKYFILKSKYFDLVNDVESSMWTSFYLLDKCDNSKQQVNSIYERIYEQVFFEYLNKDSGYYMSDDNDLLYLLNKRSFSIEKYKNNYLISLGNRYTIYTGYDKVRKKSIFSINKKQVCLILIKEILSLTYKSLKDNKKNHKNISATNLANFKFCPANYSIQTTYDLKTPKIGNLGTVMHEKQILIYNIKDEIKKRFSQFSKNKNIQQFSSNFISKKIVNSITTLLDDISESKIVFQGHNNSDTRIFYNKKINLCGSPDYIFEKKDGERFIVEEKFSLQKNNSRYLKEPYDNHRIQLGTYTMLLDEIKSSYGYVLYWFYSLSDKDVPYIRRAQLFRLDSTVSYANEVRGELNKVSQLIKTGRSSFDISDINSWKCVNCISTEVCMHKTGTQETLTLPYVISGSD